MDEGGLWVAECDNLPEDMMQKKVGVDVLRLKNCPLTTEFDLPAKIKSLEVIECVYTPSRTEYEMF